MRDGPYLSPSCTCSVDHWIDNLHFFLVILPSWTQFFFSATSTHRSDALAGDRVDLVDALTVVKNSSKRRKIHADALTVSANLFAPTRIELAV